MKIMPSNPEKPDWRHIFKFSHERSKPFMAHVREVMRGASSFSELEREVIATFVSALNNCTYCTAGHAAVARSMGADDQLMACLETGRLDGAPLDYKFSVLLAFIETLTRADQHLSEADAKAVFDAGWDEKALHDAIVVCATFSYFNKLVEGHGLEPDPKKIAEAVSALSRDNAYVL